MKYLTLLLFTTSLIFAQNQKYNAFTGKWETVEKDTELKYNAFNNKWSYEKKDAKQQYNAFENKWEYVVPD